VISCRNTYAFVVVVNATKTNTAFHNQKPRIYIPDHLKTWWKV